MSKAKPLYYNVIIFIAAQLAWLSLLGLWINRFVTRHLIISKAGSEAASLIRGAQSDWIILATGCLLFIAVSVGMSLTFRNLNMNLRLMNMYDNFIANITHELKSPLASIQLFLETMQHHDVEKQKSQEFISQMLKDTERLNKLINSILEIAGLEQKKLHFDCEIYTAGSIIRSIISESRIRHRLPAEAVTVSGEAPADCVLEKSSIQILFDNLFDNAVKYSQKGTTLNIELRQTARQIIIIFADNGIGIPQSERKNIFKKFYRIYNPRIPSVKGTGLGLYWVSEIIRYHGGSIELLDRANKKSTAFEIKLPIYTRSKKRHLDNLLKLARKRITHTGDTQ